MNAFATFRRTVCLLLLGTPLLAAAEGQWRAERVSGEVLREAHGPLADGEPLAVPARLRLSEDAALTLRHNSTRLRLRGPAALQLYPLGGDGSARLVLAEGALRAETTQPDALKINAGALRLQLSEADSWVEVADRARVCLLDGETAVQHAEAEPTYRLKEAGACLAAAPEGVLLHEWPDRATLNARLARADGGSDPLPVTSRPVGERMAATPEAPATEAGAAAPPADAWYVVIGAFSSRERAEAMLRDAGLDGRVLIAGDGGTYRSALGPLANRAAANTRREALRERFSGAWVLAPTP